MLFNTCELGSGGNVSGMATMGGSRLGWGVSGSGRLVVSWWGIPNIYSDIYCAALKLVAS